MTTETVNEDEQKQLYTVSCEGFTATCDAYIGDFSNGNGLHLLSIVGTQAATRAIAMNVLKTPPGGVLIQELHSDEEIPLYATTKRLTRNGKTEWRRKMQRLPLTKAWHILMWDRLAEPTNPKPMFVLVGTDDHQENGLKYHKSLSNRMKIPIHISWSNWLWQRALLKNEAIEMDAGGLKAWYCDTPEGDLKADIAAAVKNGILETKTLR